MLNLSRRTIGRMNDDDAIPEPIWLKGRNLWRRAEILDWLAAGAPQRSLWRWQPALLPTLDRAVSLKQAEFDSVQRELESVQLELHELRREVEESRILMAEMDDGGDEVTVVLKERGE